MFQIFVIDTAYDTHKEKSTFYSFTWIVSSIHPFNSVI